MAKDDQSGEQVRQHMRQMLVRLAALQRNRSKAQNPSTVSVDTRVKAEGEDDPPGAVREPQGPA